VTKIVHSIFKHQPLFKAGKWVIFGEVLGCYENLPWAGGDLRRNSAQWCSTCTVESKGKEWVG